MHDIINSNSGLLDTCRIQFVLGVRTDFEAHQKNIEKEKNFDYDDETIINLILDYMDNHEELDDISMTIQPARGLYKTKYGCPPNGEKLYRCISVYNPMYEDKEGWYRTVLQYAKNLSEYFNQAICTVIIENYDPEHPIQCIYFKNSYVTGKNIL